MKALLITGPVGVGKTTVAEAVGDWLAAASVPHAVIDLELELRNLSVVARDYAEAGAHLLVLAGVLERRAASRLGSAMAPGPCG